MPAESQPSVQLQIGHVLFMDLVGYSMLLLDEQRQFQEQLTEIVRDTEQVRIAKEAGKLIRLPVGDGMALVFFDSPETPVRCAIEISKRLKEYPQLKLRMGIHSGPINEVRDVNDRTNVAGAGINLARRVMDCGDGGHILLSKRVAEDLESRAPSVPASRISFSVRCTSTPCTSSRFRKLACSAGRVSSAGKTQAAGPSFLAFSTARLLFK